ncbi:MAG: single-stranded-DNA-specific exonuclease RecJ [Clostridia bacterium]|nr:single-stranded-DNA-specific exonuclease RecJ [Clostridia bacterium]
MLRYVKRNNDRTWFERPEGMPEALHALLIERSIASAAEAEAFLHPGIESLCDPFLLSDMGAAVGRIRAAVAAGEQICIYGDYDVDGVCASAIMKLWLDGIGARAQVYLPSRHLEGYGLNEAAIREIAARAKLMVTVDCGVTSVELVALARSLGLDVIVTDHHRPIGDAQNGYALPDCPVIDPLLNDYPFPYLCGAGVAWKLVWALSGQPPTDYVDIAALATVADVVPLTGENRAIVRMGLDSINAAPRPGLAALIESAGLSGKPITSSVIAFQLAPRLNAGGRLDTAMRPLRLVMSCDADEANALAEELETENAERRKVEEQILNEAQVRLRGFDFIRHRAIILAGKGWNPGVIGLAASRLVEQYNYPVVMLSDQGDHMTGSCRSIEGVDIHAALTGCAAHLQRYGGHRQAAGLTLAPEKLNDFIDAMDAWLWENVDPGVYVPVRAYDMQLRLEEVTTDLVAALEGIQPTGFGNPAPVFRAEAEVIEARAVGAGSAHLKLTLSQDSHRLGGIAFREGRKASELHTGAQVDVLFSPKLNEYMGRTTAQMEVRALSETGVGTRIAEHEGERSLQCDFLTEVLYNKKIAPFEGTVSPVEADTLAGWMCARPQGTLVLTSDLACAARLSRCISPEPDVSFGTMPEDPRAFNAVCVCPAADSIPGVYRRVVLAGVPAAYLSGRLEGTPEVYRLEECPAWMKLLPDLDAMRTAYRALMDIVRRPVRFQDLSELAHLVASSRDMDERCALASVLALSDMGLFELDMTACPPRVRRLAAQKADPEDSAVWRAIRCWREGML